MTDPEQALAECRKLGLTEGQWVTDVRAGLCQITTLSPTEVFLTAKQTGNQLYAGTAVDLLEGYQNDSIRLGERES